MHCNVCDALQRVYFNQAMLGDQFGDADVEFKVMTLEDLERMKKGTKKSAPEEGPQDPLDGDGDGDGEARRFCVGTHNSPHFARTYFVLWGGSLARCIPHTTM